jgi:RES domain-containing protein
VTTLFRIVKRKHAPAAFSGEGAKLAGGRWNFPGQRVVYCSATLALAALETIVHLGEEGRHLAFVSIAVGVPAAVRTERVTQPPPGWRDEPPGRASMEVGARWLAESRTAVLYMPSVLIPTEQNAILNPEHPDFARLRLGEPQPFSFDPRLWKSHRAG